MIDPAKVIPNPNLSLKQDAVKPFTTPRFRRHYRSLVKLCEDQGIPQNVPFKKLSASQREILWNGAGPYEGIQAFFDWLESKSYKMHVRIQLARYRGYVPCPQCHGTRLKPESRRYEWNRLNFAELCALPVSECLSLFERSSINPALKSIQQRVIQRLEYLNQVGLGYLTLDRMARTLSGGEAQRVHLTSALGTSLASTLFVLDEPSIGLHSCDSSKLTAILRTLRDGGNTVVVVEHDPEIIQAADYLIDLGPAAGEWGGERVYQGPPKGILKESRSATATALQGNLANPVPAQRREPQWDDVVQVRGARAHNLKDIDVDIPLGLLMVVTGLSGSGKSTLVRDVIYAHLAAKQGEPPEEIGECDQVSFLQDSRPIHSVDQSPPGRSSRSNPATYVGAWDEIRKIFGKEANAQGLEGGPRLFSFNVAGGRCEDCKGEGAEIVDMQFLADVRLVCSSCDGKRFSPEVLGVSWGGLSISDVLDLTVSDAFDRFADFPKIQTALRPLIDMGLGYLRLGQPTSTLSGGEAQRLKLAKNLVEFGSRPNLFLLDEPTTGLHLADVAVLVEALQNVVNQGHSIVVVEHHLHLIAAADWVLDIGPEGGPRGGSILAQGTPEQVAACPNSLTGQSLAPLLSSLSQVNP